MASTDFNYADGMHACVRDAFFRSLNFTRYMQIMCNGLKMSSSLHIIYSCRIFRCTSRAQKQPMEADEKRESGVRVESLESAR